MPDESKTLSGSLVLDSRIWWSHVNINGMKTFRGQPLRSFLSQILVSSLSWEEVGVSHGVWIVDVQHPKSYSWGGLCQKNRKRQQTKETPFSLSPSVVSQQTSQLPQRPFFGARSMRFPSSSLRNTLDAQTVFFFTTSANALHFGLSRGFHGGVSRSSPNLTERHKH